MHVNVFDSRKNDVSLQKIGGTRQFESKLSLRLLACFISVQKRQQDAMLKF